MSTGADEPVVLTKDTEITSADEAMIRSMAGATFGPNASVVLPSGRTVTGEEMTRLVGPPRTEVEFLRKELAARDEAIAELAKYPGGQESRHLAVLLILARGGDLGGMEVNNAGRWAQEHIESGEDIRALPGGRWEYFPADPSDWFLARMLSAAVDGLANTVDGFIRRRS
jgi:hypothetical protein